MGFATLMEGQQRAPAGEVQSPRHVPPSDEDLQPALHSLHANFVPAAYFGPGVILGCGAILDRGGAICGDAQSEREEDAPGVNPDLARVAPEKGPGGRLRLLMDVGGVAVLAGLGCREGVDACRKGRGGKGVLRGGRWAGGVEGWLLMDVGGVAVLAGFGGSEAVHA
jgi:hypothetical protein